MAALQQMASGELFTLSPRHVIGRAATCELRVDDPRVSGFHAQVLWDGRRWAVQDLGSRNGTMVAGRRLDSGEQVGLAVGDKLAVAGAGFVVVDDSAPHLIAMSRDGEQRIAEHDLLTLPSDQDPELTIYRDVDGTFVIESADGTHPADKATSVFAGGRVWRLMLPNSVDDTREVERERRLHGASLRFAVSRDGEHVELSLDFGGQSKALEPRAHLALLVGLARVRVKDAQRAELPASEHGWVRRNELPSMLAVDPHLVNLWIHRARKQLAGHGIRDAAAIVEHRANATQLRIGVGRLVIEDI